VRSRLAVIVAALLLPLAVPAAAVGPSYVQEVLTPGPERYVVRTGSAGELTVRARPPRFGVPLEWNRREILVRPGARPSRDQSACATWTDQSRNLDQQGLAVRFRAGPGDRRRAITLTKNTFANYVWIFNLLTWDTRRPGEAWRSLGQFDLSPVVSSNLKLLPFPWRVCLRAQGQRVDFKVWLPRREPEPAWDDPVHAHSATLPRRFGKPGVPGWYVGHLKPGDHVTYADLSSSVPRETGRAGRLGVLPALPTK
jgi:hypothetical protein